MGGQFDWLCRTLEKRVGFISEVDPGILIDFLVENGGSANASLGSIRTTAGSFFAF